MAGMKQPVIAEIAENTYAINEFGMSAMYLLVGKERALLIDTGSGVTNVKKIVEELTDLPYDVVLTHYHMDHIGGAPLFEKVYLNEKDRKLCGWETLQEDCRAYADTVGKMGAYEAFDYDISTIPSYESVPEFLDLEEGMVFELGDRPVEILFTPGHTPGSCSLLDHKTRILFSGDACNPNLLLRFGCTVSEALESLLRLEKRQAEFDRNFTGHLAYAGDCFIGSVPKRILPDAIEVCRQAVEGTAKIQTEINFLDNREVKTAVYGTVKISFL